MKSLVAFTTLLLTALQRNSDQQVCAFTISSNHRRQPHQAILQPFKTHLPQRKLSSSAIYGLFDDDDDDPNNQQSEIPPELKDEIYAAEANTAAAQGRQQRVITYVLLTIIGVTTAFFNAFLSDLRFGDGAPSSDLAYYGFGWVQSNFLTSFLFTNKIGGALGLLSAGLSGTLAEVEIRSKKENAEKIWAEMQRRKSMKENPTKSGRKKNKKKKKKSMAQSSKRDMTGKQKKRMSALEELMGDDTDDSQPPIVAEEQQQQEVKNETKDDKDGNEVPEKKEESDGGLIGTIKGFYEKADSMAASQALLLNKELEDRGMIDKITDETGLKVIGKDAAAKMQEKKNEGD